MTVVYPPKPFRDGEPADAEAEVPLTVPPGVKFTARERQLVAVHRRAHAGGRSGAAYDRHRGLGGGARVLPVDRCEAQARRGHEGERRQLLRGIRQGLRVAAPGVLRVAQPADRAAQMAAGLLPDPAVEVAGDGDESRCGTSSPLIVRATPVQTGSCSSSLSRSDAEKIGMTGAPMRWGRATAARKVAQWACVGYAIPNLCASTDSRLSSVHRRAPGVRRADASRMRSTLPQPCP